MAFSSLAKAARSATIPRFARGFSSSDSYTFELARPFKGHRLEEIPSNTVTVTKDELLKFYREMAYYRRFEINADTLYKQRLIRGFLHLYDGQEAIATGMEAAIKLTDSVITSYRCHVFMLSRGCPPEKVYAELMGRVDGCSRGKGGSMHMYWPEGNFYGGNGIVGAQVPIGAGLGFAHKYSKDGGLAVAMYGDGAANQGQVFESANMAALWKLPVIFLCENNQYAMGTSCARSTNDVEYYTRGDRVPGLWIDGMDVLACKKGFEFAADWCKSGKGPLFVEANTYRYHGHSMSDPGVSYRSKDEVNSIRAQRDPIETCKNRILEAGFATAADLKAIDKEVRVTLDAALEAAKKSPQPPAQDLFEHVYNGGLPNTFRNIEYGSWGHVNHAE